jgi:hypothetical protein
LHQFTNEVLRQFVLIGITGTDLSVDLRQTHAGFDQFTGGSGGRRKLGDSLVSQT